MNLIYSVCVSNTSTKPIEEKLKMIIRRVVKKSQTNFILDHNSSSKLFENIPSKSRKRKLETTIELKKPKLV